MKKKLKWFTISAVFLLGISCKVRVNQLKNKKDKDFSGYFKSFSQIDSYQIDSTTFTKQDLIKDVEKISGDDIFLEKSNFFGELCNQSKKYNFYKVGRIKSNKKKRLIYYLELNPTCQYDGIENYFILCEFDDAGKLISEIVLGKYYQVFGYSEVIYFDYKYDKFIRTKKEYIENEDSTINRISIDTIS